MAGQRQPELYGTTTADQLDAVVRDWASVRLPYVEVHMTNIDARGMHSVTAGEADAMITGLKVHSHELALDAMLRVLGRPGAA